MSKQKSSRSSSLSRDIYIKHKTIANNSKHRSGILERYTYKTDGGQLLSTASSEISPQRPTSELPYSRISISRERLEGPTAINLSETRFLKTRKTNNEPNVTIFKVGNSSKDDNKVRTETCDSTTDIVESFEAKHLGILRELATNTYQDSKNQCCSSYLNKASGTTVTGATATAEQTIHIDSDSDCEIIDVVSCEENADAINTKSGAIIACTSKEKYDQSSSPRPQKTVNWVSKPDPVILVISDSDDEELYRQKLKNPKHNAAYLDKEFFTFLCEKTGLRKLMPRTDDFGGSLTISTEENNTITYTKTLSVPTTIETCTDDKESVEMINEKYSVVKSKLSPLKGGSPTKTRLTTCSEREKSPEQFLDSPKRELSPPPIDISQQRAHEQLSPESMKNEFYKYLKINTNPLAQKTTAVTQNRRSNRVKNLILQMQKAKELDSIRNEYDQPSSSGKSTGKDIRKQYMKYTIPKLEFPTPALEHNTTIDFDTSFSAYAKQERLQLEEPVLQQTKHTKPGVGRKRKQIKNGQTCTTKVRKSQVGTKNATKNKQVGRKIYAVKSASHSPVKTRRKRLETLEASRKSFQVIHSDTDSCETEGLTILKGNPVNVQVPLHRSAHDSTMTKTDSEVILEKSSNKDSNATNDQLESVLFKQEVPLQTTAEVEDLLPNILAKKLSEALQKHKQDENRVTGPTPKRNVNSVETCNEINPVLLQGHSVCNIESPKELSSVDSYSKERTCDVRKNVSNTVQYKTRTTSVSSTKRRMKELSTASHVTITPQMKNESENTRSISQSSSSRSVFLGFPSEEQNVCKPFIYRYSPDCLGFSPNSDTFRINDLMKELITKYFREEDPVEPKLFSEIRSQAQNEPTVLPSTVTNESSNGNNCPETSATVDDIYSSSDYDEETNASTFNIVESATIQGGNPNYIPLNRDMRIKSLHSSLLHANSKQKSSRAKSGIFEQSDSDSSMSSPKTPKGVVVKKPTTHEIDINRNDGAVFNAYYVDDILIIVQVKLITFWKQTALGNILGVQNMWLPRGHLQRIILDPSCLNRRSSEMIMTVDNAVAYIELWTKEHKCCYRECPIADVFATIYFQQGNGAPDKKVIQLEKIKGYSDDVRFAVVKTSREIIVSWCDTASKPIKSVIRSYQLASDFQTVASIKEMESVPHYISSIHNIHDCHNLVLGAGNDQISLWNLKHGYLVMTLNMGEGAIQSLVRSNTICLYAQCNTSFLFIIQQIEVGVLRLVAVNGMTHEWKQLHSYQVPETYNKLLGVIVESGVLMTCYTNGFLCWNMHTGEILSEIDTRNEHIVLPSNKYLVAIDNYQVNVQHIMAYILTHDW